MARKDLLKGLLAPAPLGLDAAPPPLPRSQRGAIGAVSQSLADLKSRALIEVPTDLIDTAGVADRMDVDPHGLAALQTSIAEYGQQVPVLLRRSLKHEGRYDIVFGRRRVEALKQLGLPVKAMIRDLTDRDLVIAQGQENSARKDLSFIEKANFAAEMERAGYDRKVICDALSIDKTVISRMLTIVESLPSGLITAIGAAPGAGRDRWLLMAQKARGHDSDALVAAAQGSDSDARFAAVLATVNATKPAKSATDILRASDGETVGRVRKDKRKTVIELNGNSRDFAEWLINNFEDLHRAWSEKNH